MSIEGNATPHPNITTVRIGHYLFTTQREPTYIRYTCEPIDDVFTYNALVCGDNGGSSHGQAFSGWFSK